jgi:hypothetical protein
MKNQFNFCKILQITLSLALLSSALTNDIAGAKLVVNEKTIRLAIDSFLPLAAKQLKKIDLPDKDLDVDAKICNLKINLSKMSLTLQGITPENLNFSLEQPNIIKLESKGFNGYALLHIELKCGALPQAGYDIRVYIDKLDFEAEIVLDQVRSATDADKMMPSFYIRKINFPAFSFDFTTGSIVEILQPFVKQAIRLYLNTIGIKQIKDNIENLSKKVFAKVIKDLPVYFPIGSFAPFLQDHAVDISLTAPFKVIDKNMIVLNGNGALINLSDPETKTSTVPIPDYLPEGDPEGKDIQIFISEYFIERALYTLNKSEKLKYTITPELLAPISLILNTAFIEPLFSGTVKRYGDNKSVNIKISALDKPDISLNEDITIKSKAKFSVRVFNDHTYEECIVVSCNAHIVLSASLKEHGKISLAIKKLTVSNGHIDNSLIGYPELGQLESFVNISAAIFLPVLNEKHLKEITLPLPDLEGFDISDMTAGVKNRYVEFNASPRAKPKALLFLQEFLEEDDFDF